ncbi:gluconeogenesis factor YvcK family protein [Jatrophihabitans sp. DSM 45814]
MAEPTNPSSSAATGAPLDGTPASPTATPRRQRVVAFGGGHGLYASLSALRLLDVDVTAVVTVADDGGSSGRIRRELDVLPPGDLRMALAALAADRLHAPDRESPGRQSPEGQSPVSLAWSEILQHRMGGSGVLAGHPVGNLMLTGLMELRGDAVTALDDLGAIVGARGRVLPMSAQPLDLVAEVVSVDPDDPVQIRTIRGQSSIAATAGRVRSIQLIPPDPPACVEALQAIAAADVIILGPGSWFTSVIPHLLVPELARALLGTAARMLVLLNLEPQVGETDDFSPEEHLRVLTRHCPGLRIDAVIADSDAVAEPRSLQNYVASLEADLFLARVAAQGAGARHDPVKLSLALDRAFSLNRTVETGAGKHEVVSEKGVH